MGLLLSYGLRSVRARRFTTILTAAAVALTTVIFIVLMALAQGIQEAFTRTGDVLNVIVLRKGSTSESNSALNREKIDKLRAVEGLATATDGTPLMSEELSVVASVTRSDGTEANLLVRGMTPRGREVRTGVNLIEGRWPEPGREEVAVGIRLRETLRQEGGVRFRNRSWPIVGVFEAQGRIHESELWTDVHALKGAFKFECSSAVLRARDRASAERIRRELDGDRWLNVDALDEREYYGRQTRAWRAIEATAWLAAILLGIGAAFTAMNTMYASLASRTREVATMKVLGFRRWSIRSVFLLEALAISLVGGIVGCGVGFTVHGAAAAVTQGQTFSEIQFQFHVTGSVLLTALLLALGAGAVGGWLPAVAASRMPAAAGLRGD